MLAEGIQAFFYVFRQFYRANVNFDLYYFLAVWGMFSVVLKKRKLCLEWIRWSMLYWISGTVIWLFAVHRFSFLETVVYLVKIEAGIVLFLYVRENIHKLDICRWFGIVTWFLFILDLFAVVFYASDLWRHNDSVNVYSATRLQLLYFEPSELSMCCGILLVIYFFFIRKRYAFRKRIFFFSVLAANIVLSAGIGGMLSFVIALMVGLLYKNRNYFSRGSAPKAFCVLVFLGIVVLLLFLYSDLPVALRLKAMLTGNDGSLYGRFTVPLMVLNPLLRDTKLLGLGFGNMNSGQGLSLIYNYGLSRGTSAAIIAFPNSYLHIIGEAGVLGAFILVIQLSYLVRKVKETQCVLQAALLVFIIVYQVMGGYYTNLLNWVIYGVIAARNQFDELYTRAGRCDVYQRRAEV